MALQFNYHLSLSYQYRCLASLGGYDLEYLEVVSMVVTWWIVGSTVRVMQLIYQLPCIHNEAVT